ncbi:MAG: hypothetical protein GC200_04355 [Tepidisphaera sp.]|nr:hypothetical protein [Tepidisphaera sp.]
MNRFDLYELCVQNAPAMARFLEAAHRGSPCTLREDFSGGAALCKAWVAPASGADSEHRRAIAVDLDPEPLKRVAKHPGITVRRADVRRAADKADIIAALNFPLGYWHDRASLVAYLKLTRARLNRKGVFVADLYGGSDAFRPLTMSRRFRGPKGERIKYTWEQEQADAISGLVHNALHFEVSPPRGKPGRTRVLRRAFTYHWRLWSIPEFTDAALQAGFKHVEVYDQDAGALDHTGRLHIRPAEAAELDDNYVVYVVARK